MEGTPRGAAAPQAETGARPEAPEATAPPSRTAPVRVHSPAEPPRLPVGQVTTGSLRPLPRPVAQGPLWKRILAIAWPVVATNFLQSLTLTVDLLFVAALGTGALAAAGVATQVFALAMAVGAGLGAGATAIVAREIGAGDVDGAHRSTWNALLLSLLVSAPLTVALTVWGEPLLRLFGTDPALLPEAVMFLEVLALGLPGQFLLSAATGALQGAADTRPGLYVNLGVNGVNVLFDALIIYGAAGFPAMGLRGAATATTLSYLAGAAILLLILTFGNRPLRLRSGKLDATEAGRVARIGAPAALEQLLLSVGFTLYLVLILRFGADALAAHSIGLRVQSFAFNPGLGFATAAAALVGQALGSGNPQEAEEEGWACIRIGLAVMVALSLPLLLLADPLAAAFVPEGEARRLGALWIRLVALAIPAIAIHFTAAGALRGAGDTRWPLLVSFIGLIAIRLPLAWLLAIPLGFGMNGIWAAYILEYYARAAITTVRFRNGKWKTIVV